MSIFDRPYIEGIFGGVEFTDGTLAIDHVEDLIECQKVFMEVVAEIRRVQNMFTYPVLTYSLLKRKNLSREEVKKMIETKNWDIFVDKDFARWCSDHNVEWSDSNFFCSDNVGVLSNCPLAPTTNVAYKDETGNIVVTEIENLYWMMQNGKIPKHVTMFSGGNPIEVKINQFDVPVTHRIVLTDGTHFDTTANHLNVVKDRDYVPTKELRVGDSLKKYNSVDSSEFVWVEVSAIEEIDGPCVSYCVEVIGDCEPVFTLANCVETHNCRLLSDTTKLDAFINSIGGTALSVGSCRVSTINLVRIAYESGLNKKKYIKILKDRVLLDCKALYSMRHILKRNIEKGLLPNYQDGAVELSKQFCTIGAIGCYEVMDMFGLINTDEFGCKSYSDEAVEFTTQILDTMNQVKDSFDCDFTFNIEMIPAENCAGVICQADNLLYEQNKYFIYSNQWIPLMEKCTIEEKCRLGSLFDEKCGGGCIAHINIENRFANTDEAWDMLNYVAAMGVIYFAFTTKISVCKNKHAFISEKTCPVCGEPIADTYARVVG